jgi:hypothetical protein
MNPALDVIRLEVGGTRIPLSLVSAEKNLALLPPGHFLREKVENPDAIREVAAKEPADAVRRLLESFGRPLPAGEVREHFAGIVGDDRWSSFWTSARRHPQLLVAGAAKSALVSWSASADAADDTVRQEFVAADPAHKLDLARKHGKRSRELAQFFAGSLASEARRTAAEGNLSLAWELSQAAARLSPGEPEAFPAEALLAARDLPEVIRRMRDHTARERALEVVRAHRDDWEAGFAARADLEGALKDRFRGHPALAAVVAQNPMASAADPAEAARRIARWLRFAPGEVYYLAGRGAGRIAEMNPALDVIRLEVGGTRIPLSLVSAEKNLESRAPGPEQPVKG